MGGKNHHSEPFDASTLVKLDLYRRYVRAWIPVFLNSGIAPQRIQIFDFFAGPGRDLNGVSGSPVIALEEIKLALVKDHRNHPGILKICCEGVYDALSYTNGVGLAGRVLTDYQKKLLSVRWPHHKLVMALDNDQAGKNSIDSCRQIRTVLRYVFSGIIRQSRCRHPLQSDLQSSNRILQRFFDGDTFRVS